MSPLSGENILQEQNKIKFKKVRKFVTNRMAIKD